MDGERILNGAQGKHARILHSRRGRNDRPCTGREQELIVCFLIRLARFEVFDGDGLIFAVDGERLAQDAHIHPIARKKGCRRLKREFFLVLDFPAHVVGKPAICIGDVSRTFQHDDLCPLVQTADTCRRSCTACDAPDDDNFHNAS